MSTRAPFGLALQKKGGEALHLWAREELNSAVHLRVNKKDAVF
jgi:hypothetical protein